MSDVKSVPKEYDKVKDKIRLLEAKKIKEEAGKSIEFQEKIKRLEKEYFNEDPEEVEEPKKKKGFKFKVSIKK